MKRRHNSKTLKAPSKQVTLKRFIPLLHGKDTNFWTLEFFTSATRLNGLTVQILLQYCFHRSAQIFASTGQHWNGSFYQWRATTISNKMSWDTSPIILRGQSISGHVVRPFASGMSQKWIDRENW